MLCRYLKEVKPAITEIQYFSDGAASQYKNFKNFTNLEHHKQDHGLTAKWHFFATSHGKSPCDGIGGTVKRLAARASLQATTTNHILTPLQMYQWATSHVHGIAFIYVEKEVVEEETEAQEIRFRAAKKIPGTRCHHCFIPEESGQLRMYRISSDVNGTLTQDSESGPDLQLYRPGTYVAAVYDQAWYVGSIVKTDDEKQDLLITFMKQTGPGSSKFFKWPAQKDECWLPVAHVLCSLKVPSTTTTGRQYQFLNQEIENIKKLFATFSAAHY